MSKLTQNTTDLQAILDAVNELPELDSMTYMLVDETGEEYPAVYVNEETVFTATANDIRKGTVAATASGVTEGTKEIPAYVTAQGVRVVTAGSNFNLPHADYDYTKLQALFCSFNTNLDDSVATDKVVIENSVYNVSSSEALSTVVKDHDIGQILFGITNETNNRYLIRYFMYKEVY